MDIYSKKNYGYSTELGLSLKFILEEELFKNTAGFIEANDDYEPVYLRLTGEFEGVIIPLSLHDFNTLVELVKPPEEFRDEDSVKTFSLMILKETWGEGFGEFRHGESYEGGTYVCVHTSTDSYLIRFVRVIDEQDEDGVYLEFKISQKDRYIPPPKPPICCDCGC